MVVPYPRIFVVVFLIIVPLLCLCGLAKRFCRNCRKSEQDPPTDHEGPPERPPITPAERVTASICEPPPPYSEVGIHPNPCPVPRLSVPPHSDF